MWCTVNYTAAFPCCTTSFFHLISVNRYPVKSAFTICSKMRYSDLRINANICRKMLTECNICDVWFPLDGLLGYWLGCSLFGCFYLCALGFLHLIPTNYILYFHFDVCVFSFELILCYVCSCPTNSQLFPVVIMPAVFIVFISSNFVECIQPCSSRYTGGVDLLSKYGFRSLLLMFNSVPIISARIWFTLPVVSWTS